MIEPADPRPPDVEHVAVEQVRVGDVLSMSGDSDPARTFFEWPTWTSETNSSPASSRG